MCLGNSRNGDEVDGGRGITGLLTRLNGDLGHVSLLGGCELEMLSDMDPDSLTDIVPDRYISPLTLPTLINNYCNRQVLKICGSYVNIL